MTYTDEGSSSAPDDPGPLDRTAGRPLYSLAAERIERWIMSRPLSESGPLPPEGALTKELDISRGTLRRATELLAQQGLLSIQAGRGTYVDQSAKVRRLVWSRLREVARPDSRFHFDLSRFIPDFDGREEADTRLLGLAAVASAAHAFVAPDNSLESIRHRLLEAGTDLLVPTYDLKRGLIELDAHAIPAHALGLAATLDGMERFGRRLTLDQLRRLDPVDVVISGAVAATEQGVHFGSGAGNVDLEWALLRHIGLADAATPIIISIHDCQLLDADIPPGPRDVVADVVVTPTRLIETDHDFPKPDDAYWLSSRRHGALRRTFDPT